MSGDTNTVKLHGVAKPQVRSTSTLNRVGGRGGGLAMRRSVDTDPWRIYRQETGFVDSEFALELLAVP